MAAYKRNIVCPLNVVWWHGEVRMRIVPPSLTVILFLPDAASALRQSGTNVF